MEAFEVVCVCVCVIREREIERVGTFRERVIESECEQLSQRLRLVS